MTTALTEEATYEEIQQALKHLKARWMELYLDTPWTRGNLRQRAAIIEKLARWREL